MIVGYARISINGPTVESQTLSLQNARCKRIFVDQMSGQSRDRSELDRCLRILDEGDKLVVCRLDKLACSLRDLIFILEGLEERGIQFLSLSEGINTKCATGKLIVQFFATLAEFERNLIRERTMLGLEIAKGNGRRGGCKKKTTGADDRRIIALWKSKKHSIPELADMSGLSVATIRRRIGAHKKNALTRQRSNRSPPQLT